VRSYCCFIHTFLANISIANARVADSRSLISLPELDVFITLSSIPDLNVHIDFDPVTTQPSATPMVPSRSDSTIPGPSQSIALASHSALKLNMITASSPAHIIAASNYGAPLKTKNAAATTGSRAANYSRTSMRRPRYADKTVTVVSWVTINAFRSPSLRKDVGSGENNKTAVSTDTAGPHTSRTMLSGGSAKNDTRTKPSHPTRYTPGPEVPHNSKATVTQETSTTSVSSNLNLATDTIHRITCTGSTSNSSLDTTIALTCFYSGSPPAPSNDTSSCHNHSSPRIPGNPSNPGNAGSPGNPGSPSNPAGSKPVDDDAADSPKAPQATLDRINDAISVLYAVVKGVCHVIDITGALRNIYETVKQAINCYGGAIIAIWLACHRL
jgi:hypothetical protein